MGEEGRDLLRTYLFGIFWVQWIDELMWAMMVELFWGNFWMFFLFFYSKEITLVLYSCLKILGFFGSKGYN